jgi:hypothetical protein
MLSRPRSTGSLVSPGQRLGRGAVEVENDGALEEVLCCDNRKSGLR